MSTRKMHGLGHVLGAVLFGTLAATATHAERVPMAVMGKGKSMTKAECAALPQAVWIKAMGRDICIRYYLSTAGGQGTRPVVFLQGDAPSTNDVNTDDLVKYADRISKSSKTTGIYLARLGRDGSSGSHANRHTQLELYATNAALEAIKQLHHFEGFHIYGHSGGANLVAALLGLRTDLVCAVPADGKLAGSGKRNVSDPALQIFWASDAIPKIARNRGARIIVVIDPQDRIVPMSNQLPFVEKLRRAGGKVEVFFVNSGGDEHADHHATTGHAALVMRECVRGTNHDQIAADLAELVADHHKAALQAAKAKGAKQSDTKSGQRNTR